MIKAWDCAIANMKKGEVARVTCHPDYAYGSNGRPPLIPPNATLVFDIELIKWKGLCFDYISFVEVLEHLLFLDC